MSSGRGKSNDAGTWRSAHSLAKRAAGENTMKLMDGFDSNYRYILVAARRARQLQGGAPPVIETLSRKPCRIAQDEIRNLSSRLPSLHFRERKSFPAFPPDQALKSPMSTLRSSTLPSRIPSMHGWWPPPLLMF